MGNRIEQLKPRLQEAVTGGREIAANLLHVLAEGIQPNELLSAQDFYLACGSGNVPLAEKTAQILQTNLDKTMHPDEDNPAVRRFRDGEARPIFDQPLKNKAVFIMQSPSPAFLIPESNPPQYSQGINDHIVELMLMIDAVRRADADEVNVIMPYHPYARQDRKSQPREPISVAAIDQTLEFLGADHLLTIDLHSKQSMGGIQKPYDVINASYSLVPWIKEHISLSNLTVVSPDTGGVRMAGKYAEMLFGEKREVGVTLKVRDPVSGEIASFNVVGDIKGKDVLIIDDIIASGGTLCACVEQLKKQGAGNVYAAIVHGLFGADCLNRLHNCNPLQYVLTTDTIDHRPEILTEADQTDGKIKLVSVAAPLAEAIQCMYTGQSMDKLFLV